MAYAMTQLDIRGNTIETHVDNLVSRGDTGGHR